jgi:hypothetical protein
MRELNQSTPIYRGSPLSPQSKDALPFRSSKVIAVVDRVTEGEKPSWCFALGAQDAAEFAERYGNSLGFCFNFEDMTSTTPSVSTSPRFSCG